MGQAKSGDIVRVHYTGTLKDRTVFDSSIEREPMEFVLGQGKMIPGFENAIIGMKKGDKTTITLAPENAYGVHMKELEVEIPRSSLPPELEPREGMVLQGQSNKGNSMEAVIIEIKEDTIVLDTNHFLAGKDLTFEIELLEIL